ASRRSCSARIMGRDNALSDFSASSVAMPRRAPSVPVSSSNCRFIVTSCAWYGHPLRTVSPASAGKLQSGVAEECRKPATRQLEAGPARRIRKALHGRAARVPAPGACGGQGDLSSGTADLQCPEFNAAG
nr:hypothetical protein [Tanacetum cinerariifolium]